MEIRDANKLTHDLRNHLAVAMMEAEMAGAKSTVKALETATKTLTELEQVINKVSPSNFLHRKRPY